MERTVAGESLKSRRLPTTGVSEHAWCLSRVYDCFHACLVINLGTTLARKNTFAVPASLTFLFFCIFISPQIKLFLFVYDEGRPEVGGVARGQRTEVLKHKQINKTRRRRKAGTSAAKLAKESSQKSPRNNSGNWRSSHANFTQTYSMYNTPLEPPELIEPIEPRGTSRTTLYTAINCCPSICLYK